MSESDGLTDSYELNNSSPRANETYPVLKNLSFRRIVHKHENLASLRCPFQFNIELESHLLVEIFHEWKRLEEEFMELVLRRKEVHSITVCDMSIATSFATMEIISLLISHYNVRELQFLNTESYRTEDIVVLASVLNDCFNKYGENMELTSFVMDIYKEKDPHCRIVESCFFPLFHLFTRLKNFQRLSFSLQSKAFVTRSLLESISKMEHLTRIELPFSNFSIATLPFSSLKNLQKLSIFRSTVSPTQIGQLTNLIETSTTLVYLNFSNIRIRDKDYWGISLACEKYRQFAKALFKNQTLRVLYCWQDGWESEKTNVKILKSVLSNNITKVAVGGVNDNIRIEDLVLLSTRILTEKRDMVLCEACWEIYPSDEIKDKSWYALHYDLAHDHPTIRGMFLDSFWARGTEKYARIRQNRLWDVYDRNISNHYVRRDTLITLMYNHLKIDKTPITEFFPNHRSKRQRGE